VLLIVKLNKTFEKIKQNKIQHFFLFLILFLLFLFVFILLTNNLDLSKPYAILTSKILFANNQSNIIFYTGENYSLAIGNNIINILSVCTGLFELCVFLALIFGNLLVSWKNKFVGALFLIVLFFYFNLIRIIVMIWLLQNVNLQVVDVLHTILFKLGFFIFFIFFYYIWLIKSQNTEKKVK